MIGSVPAKWFLAGSAPANRLLEIEKWFEFVCVIYHHICDIQYGMLTFPGLRVRFWRSKIPVMVIFRL